MVFMRISAAAMLGTFVVISKIASFYDRAIKFGIYRPMLW